ncbi:DUF4259 domain-containing protein [Streptomyces sp. HO565]|uniref:DUF4259 domain-containing protein n=1 Tax=Streptomyces sp. HO565 TaxID=2857489 RepID=UPI0034DC039F
MLAVDALDQVVSERSELAEQWAEAANWPKWRQEITHLRDLLDPPIPPQEEALFVSDITLPWNRAFLPLSNGRS